MEIGEWIALIGLILFWASSIIVFWVKINIKLVELELMIKNGKENLDEHIKWGEGERDRLDGKIDTMVQDNRIEHKEIIVKMDLIIENLNEFKVYIIEKTYKK